MVRDLWIQQAFFSHDYPDMKDFRIDTENFVEQFTGECKAPDLRYKIEEYICRYISSHPHMILFNGTIDYDHAIICRNITSEYDEEESSDKLMIFNISGISYSDAEPLCNQLRIGLI